LLVAIAVGIGVVVAFFLSSTSYCDDSDCGQVERPQQAAPVAAIPSGTAKPQGGGSTPASPAAPTPGASDPAGGPGAPNFAYGLQVDNPAQPASTPNPGSNAIGAQLNSGGLRVSPSKPGTGQGMLHVDALTRTAFGSLDPLIVQDFRGSRAGWTLTVTMSDFVSPRGYRIGAENLEWTPSCKPHKGASYPSKAEPGSPTSMSRTALLCSTPSLNTVTGGEFDVGADFAMRLPDSAPPTGTYTSTLLLTLT
jgi:hypothetical protein